MICLIYYKHQKYPSAKRYRYRMFLILVSLKIWCIYLAMVSVFTYSIGPKEIGEKQEHGRQNITDTVGPLVKISDCIFFLMLLAWVMPYYNRGVASVQGLIGLVWGITTFFNFLNNYISSCNSTGWISFLFNFYYFCVSYARLIYGLVKV